LFTIYNYLINQSIKIEFGKGWRIQPRPAVE